MAVKIRLKRTGSKRRPFYRIVVMDSRAPRDGRPIEEVGRYSPVMPVEQCVTVALDRIEYWKGHGAQMTETVRSLLKRAARNAN